MFNLDSLSQDKQQIFKDYISRIASKIIAANPSRELVPFGLIAQIPGVDLYPKPLSEGEFTNQKFEHMMTALNHSKNLEGSFLIWSEDKKLLHVEDGEIICDTLNIISDLNLDKVDTAFRENLGQELLMYVNASLKVIGEKTKSGGLYFEGKNYVYTCKNGQLSVRTIAERKEVLNMGGFTKEATESDINTLSSFKKLAQELKLDAPNSASKFKL